MSEGVASVDLERLYALYRSLPEFQSQLSLDEVRRRVGERYLALVYSAGGEDQGFKLGYAREPGEVYSWLGGVSPASRGRGIAQRLLEEDPLWSKIQFSKSLTGDH